MKLDNYLDKIKKAEPRLLWNSRNYWCLYMLVVVLYFNSVPVASSFWYSGVDGEGFMKGKEIRQVMEALFVTKGSWLLEEKGKSYLYVVPLKYRISATIFNEEINSNYSLMSYRRVRKVFSLLGLKISEIKKEQKINEKYIKEVLVPRYGIYDLLARRDNLINRIINDLV